MSLIVRILPRALVSRAVGWFVDQALPRRLVDCILSCYVRFYSVDLSEAASSSLSDYPSVGAFFSRPLRSGSRTIENPPVSPVDGTLRWVSEIESTQAIIAKNHEYALAEFLGAPQASDLVGGTLFHFYLSPRDYHRIHAPVDGALSLVRAIGGDLWPVNDWSLRHVPRLFLANERVVLTFEHRGQSVYLVLIAALNVGRISLHLSERDQRVSSRHQRVTEVAALPEELYRAGQELGYFSLGSSAVLLLPSSMTQRREVAVGAPCVVEVGNTLLLPER